MIQDHFTPNKKLIPFRKQGANHRQNQQAHSNQAAINAANVCVNCKKYSLNELANQISELRKIIESHNSVSDSAPYFPKVDRNAHTLAKINNHIIDVNDILNLPIPSKNDSEISSSDKEDTKSQEEIPLPNMPKSRIFKKDQKEFEKTDKTKTIDMPTSKLKGNSEKETGEGDIFEPLP